MSYEAERLKLGRESAIIAELYLDCCSLTFGVAPCTASAAGPNKCYNTFPTCQDKPNFAKATRVYRFATTRIDRIQALGDAPTFPTLVNVDTAPTVLTPGQGLGVRSSVTITIQDHPWTDAGIDPYLAGRGRNAENLGTFWGKLIRRNFNYEGRRIDILSGFLDDDGKYNAANFRRRTYIIVQIAGPNENGAITITAKDPLKFADNDKAKWPLASTAKLVADITDVQTSFQINDTGGYIASNYALGQMYLKIDTEIMRMTALSGSGTVTVTVVRASAPSYYDQAANVAEDHKADASVQQCWHFYDTPVADIVYFLLNDVVGLDPSFLPKSEWDAEMANGFSLYRFSALIATPTGVKDLLQEISEHNQLIWWDERFQKVRMRGMISKPPSVTTVYGQDREMIAGTSDVNDDYKSRCTEVWVFYGDRFPLLDRNKPATYSRMEIRADLDAEAPEMYDGAVVKTFYSRWLNANPLISGEVAARYLTNNKRAKKVMTFTIDPKDDNQWTGDVIAVKSPLIQDQHGNAAAVNMLITQVEEALSSGGFAYKLTLTEQSTLERAGVIAPSSLDGTVYSSATETIKARYIFVCPDSGRFADGSPGYQIQ